MNEEELCNLLEQLVKQPKESEWVEFKQNFHSIEEIGEGLSALSNGASLHNKASGYIVFGIKDEVQTIMGTSFKPKSMKKGNEEIEHWLAQRLNPRVDFQIFEFHYKGHKIALFEIQAAMNQPVEFMNQAYIRIGSITRKLREFPEKARKIWKKSSSRIFEREVAMSNLSSEKVVGLLDTQAFFELFGLPYPSTRDGVIERLESEKVIFRSKNSWSITNSGALLFAKNLTDFDTVARKAPRVIIYDGINKLRTIKEQTGRKGYAIGFEGLVDYIYDQLPTNEAIESAIRQQVHLYPKLAIRELVANALIHQDFEISGSGPMIEIFSDRIEVTNPGLPLITTIRFIDEYQSRNEDLASMMRRIGICEEKGSGIDKVVFHSEVFQLPAPDFKTHEKHTKAILFAPKSSSDMNREDKVRACYQHCSLKYVSNEKMTNQSLRERFKIENRNAAIASRIIKDTLDEGLIKDEDPKSKSRKYARYIPFWA